MLGQGGQQYGAMIGDGENSRFMGFGLLGLWIFDIFFGFFLLVFLVLLCMGFLVFDFIFCAIFFLKFENLSMKLLGFSLKLDWRLGK